MRARALTICLPSLLLLMTVAALPAAGQQTEKRSDVEFLPVGPPPEEAAGQAWGLYNFSTTLEVGWLFTDVGGNVDIFRSHINQIHDGPRAFDFSLRAKGAPGAFFSNFYVEGAGWGGDPSNWLRYGASKERWFDFRGTYRRTDYYWLFPGFARGQHRNDQQRRWQTFDLTILPKRPLRFRAGYSRNSSTGLALTTYDFSRDEFLLFEPVRRTYDEYRGGLEWTLHRWTLFFEQSYRFLRNDRLLVLPPAPIPNPGNNAGGNTTLSEVERSYPIRSRIPYSRATLAGRPHPRLDVTARFLYSDIDMNASRLETNIGRNFSGQDVVVVSDSVAAADRPNAVADGAVTWRPLPKLTFSNVFSFNQFSIGGTGLSTSFTFFPATGASTTAEENPLNILRYKNYQNRFEGRYDFTPKVGVRAGYLYTHRDVHMSHFEDGVLDEEEDADLGTHTLLLGANVRPRRTLGFFFDWEHGKADNVFTRLSAADVDRFRLRGRWEPTRGLRFSASWFIFDNTNPNPLIDSTQHNRGVSVDFQFTRYERGYLNVGYSRNDISSLTPIVFFAGGTPATLRSGNSVFIANDNYAYIDFGGRLIRQLYFDGGYRVVNDSGTFPPSDPRGTCDVFTAVCSNLTGLDPIGVSFGGLNFHQPHAALRYVFSDRVSWKAGWRWYGYNQKLGTESDYRAHIVTTSLVLIF